MIVALIIFGALVVVGLPLYLLNRYQERRAARSGADASASASATVVAEGRQRGASTATETEGASSSASSSTETEAEAEVSNAEVLEVEAEADAAEIDSEVCCGMHITCEKDSLLADVSEQIDYFDDEELDRFAGRAADDYKPEEIEEFRDVLLTLIPEDIAPWARSIQLRGIQLPTEVREELLMIVAEARKNV
jgi:hypothetical protein